ncbi:hypothetical protein HYU22_03975 [Candidatus Woesearchaeota archaeon]|nr:hypothetical protein [Candidatus Woesearchaeota archaeon]
MALTSREKAILKALVGQELAHLKKDKKNLSILNSPVLSGIYRMKEMDLPFLRNQAAYQRFLVALKKKL